MAAEKSAPLAIREPIIVFGHALFFAWYLIVVCTLSVGFPATGAIYPPVFSQFVLLLSAGISTIALSHGAPAGFFGRKHYSKGTSIAAFVMGALPCLLVVVGVWKGSPQPVFTVLLFLTGVGVVYFFSAWEDLTMECGPGNPILSTATAFMLGAALFLVSYLFPLREAAVLSLIYLVLSTAMIMVVGRTAHKDEEGNPDMGVEDVDADAVQPPKDLPRQLKSNLLFFLISFCSGFVLAITSATSQTLLVQAFFIGVVLCAAAIGLFWMTKRIISIDTLMMSDAAIITMAFILVLAVRNEVMTAVAVCAIMAAWTMFRAFNCGLNMNRALRLGQPSVQATAASNTSINIGLPLGCLIACLMLKMDTRPEVFLGVCAALAILLVIFCFLVRPLVSDLSDSAPPEASSRSFEELAQKCMIVAEEYHLSPREGEILCYLARGRSAKRIADDLVLSEHTVKSHVYRIYRKIGVHTRQELIDLVETRASEWARMSPGEAPKGEADHTG